jgi:hypothetical protein
MARRGVTLLRAEPRGPADDGLELPRQVPQLVADGHRVAARLLGLGEDLLQRGALHRLLQRDALVEDEPHRVLIAAAGKLGVAALGLLRRHVRGRAYRRADARARQVGGLVPVRLVQLDPHLQRLPAGAHGPGDAPVHQVHVVVAPDHHVGGLEVAVNDALLVRHVERVADLEEVLQPLLQRVVQVERQPLLEGYARVVQEVLQVAALDELHRVPERPVRRDLERVDRHDVGVLELRRDLHLRQETAEELRVRRHLGQHRLQRDLAPQVEVPRDADGPHGPLPEHGDRRVAHVDRRRRRRGRRRRRRRRGPLTSGPALRDGRLLPRRELRPRQRRVVHLGDLHRARGVQLLEQGGVDDPCRAQEPEEPLDAVGPALGAVGGVERPEIQLHVLVHALLQLGEIHGAPR